MEARIPLVARIEEAPEPLERLRSRGLRGLPNRGHTQRGSSVGKANRSDMPSD